MKILILLSVLGAVVSDSQNIPVTDRFGMRAYADVEEVLEIALLTQLRPQGVTKVEVDDQRNDPSAFEVELYSREPLGDGFKASLEKVLRSDLGFTDVVVKSEPKEAQLYRRRWFYGNKVRCYVYFNAATMMQTLQGVARRVMQTANLSLEDSMWD